MLCRRVARHVLGRSARSGSLSWCGRGGGNLCLATVSVTCRHRAFLAGMGWLVANAEFEYYCDGVAANVCGGNVVQAALEKMLDLNLAMLRMAESIGS